MAAPARPRRGVPDHGPAACSVRPRLTAHSGAGRTRRQAPREREPKRWSFGQVCAWVVSFISQSASCEKWRPAGSAAAGAAIGQRAYEPLPTRWNVIVVRLRRPSISLPLFFGAERLLDVIGMRAAGAA